MSSSRTSRSAWPAASNTSTPRTGALPDLRGRAAVRPRGRAAVDHDGPGVGDQGYRTVLRQEPYGLWGIGTEPKFAIGQRALLVPGEGGNLLWDCVTYLDDDTVAAVTELGGISAIAISHPHYYSAMVEWSEAFGGVPIYIHAGDARVGAATWDAFLGQRFHRGATGPTLYRAGIHFAGGTIVHWADGAGGVEPSVPATSSRSSKTVVGSASCTATRT